MFIKEEIFNHGQVVLFKWRNEEGWPVEYVSKNVESVLGYSVDEFVSGQVGYGSILHPLDMKRVEEEVEKNVDLGKNYFQHRSYRVIAKNGAVKWLDDLTYIDRQKNGTQEVISYYGYIIDITEMKQVENELIKAYENLSPMIREKTKDLQNQLDFEQKLIDSIPNPVFSKDEDHNYLFYNKAFCDFFGVGEKEIIGKSFSQIYPNKEKIDEIIEQDNLLFETVGSKIFDTTIKNVQGEERQIVLNKSVFVLGEEEKKTMVGTVVDISRVKKMEKEINHLQKMEAVGHLAGGIAHEINTPIQYIGDNLRFLEGGIEDLAKAYNSLLEITKKNKVKIDDKVDVEDIKFLIEDMPDAIEQAMGGVKTVSEIVGAMKSFVHPGKKAKDKVDINKIVKTAITVSRNEWKYDSEIKTKFDENLPLVDGLENELLQVVLNLIINSSQAVSEKHSKKQDSGEIIIVTKQTPDSVKIEVWDDGIGIKEEHKEDIFNPFFTTKEVGTGSGQGLPLCYDVVVKKHGGKIDFNSKYGEGSCFVISLPTTYQEGEN